MTCQNCGNELAPSLKFCPKCGTPASAPSYAPPPINEIQSSWSQDPQFAPTPQPKRKSKVGKVLLIIGMVLVLIAAGVGVAIYYGYKYVERTLKSSEAYTLAVSTLTESAAVKEKLGAIKSTGFPLGNFEERGSTGHASFNMSVEGEKASGRYYVDMNRAQSKWRINRAYVDVKGGEIIDVVDPSDEQKPEGNANINDNSNANSDANQPRAGNSNQKTIPKTISGGVLNGKATSLPKPPYPPAARAARAQGTVTVQVTVDEEGKVVSANAVSGHPLLQAAAVSAARQARFSPTLLAGKPVKVTGILTYIFTLEE